MTTPRPRPRPLQGVPAKPPEGFRDGLAELFQLGLRVGRMVAEVADEEKALAKAATVVRAAEAVSTPPESLAQAIEVDRATLAAHEARPAVVARAESVATAFAKVSRAVRQTVLLVERIDRGWAVRGMADDRHAMALRQVRRGVEDAIGREADDERAEHLNEVLTERLESLDVEREIGDRPVKEIIGEICSDLGLAAEQVTKRSAERGAAWPQDALGAAMPAGDLGRKDYPPRRRPDG